MKRKLILSALCLAALIAVLVWTQAPSSVSAAPADQDSLVCGCLDRNDKVTICHADGLAGTIKFSTLTIPCHAASAHIGAQGTVNAGHEEDVCGEKGECPTNGD